MVWNTENSPLYRTVESFNNRSPEPEPPRSAPEPPPQEVRRDCGRPANSAPGGFLQRLTSDRDSLLIIGLIVLLLREKADMKLIAALAFILLT